MKAISLIALLLCFPALLSPQQTVPIPKGAKIEPALTKGQCRTELLLMAKVSKDQGNTFLQKFPGPQIFDAMQRMTKCRAIDPEMEPAYADGATTHMSELLVRQADFIGRHNLTDQYVKEDAEGLR